MAQLAAIIGRILLGALFILSGIQKLAAPEASAAYIGSMTTLPGTLAVPTGVFELVAGGLLAIGLMTRLAAILLAAFTGLTVFFFHHQFTDLEQGAHALKNVALIGGLLMAFAYAQIRATHDRIEAGRLAAVAAREAEQRIHAAEVAAARAEGRADAAGAGVTTSVTHVEHDGLVARAPHRAWWRY